MTLRIRLPGGTLKVKSYRELRSAERDRKVPVLKVGSKLYFTWWAKGAEARFARPSDGGAPKRN